MTLLTLGEKLKKERLSKGISLQEISSATRISMEFLQGLERDDYSSFPAKVFVTGFLRSYAKHLGVDSDKIIDEYEQIEGEKIERETVTDYSDTKFEKFGITVLVPVLLACLVGYLIYINVGGGDKKDRPVVSKTKTERPKEVEVTDGREESEKKLSNGEPIKSDLSLTEKTIPVEEKPKIDIVVKRKKEKKKPALSAKKKETTAVYKYKVELAADNQDVWVFAEIDGKNTRDLFVRAGNRVRFKGNKSFNLTVGNPKHLKIFLNGKEIRMNVPSSGVLRKWDIPLE